MSSFNLGCSLNNFADTFNSYSIVNGVLSNPIFTSLLIVFIILLIFYYIFNKQVNKKYTKLYLSASFYILFSVSFIIFLHYYSIKKSLKETYIQKEIIDIYTSIDTVKKTQSPDYTPVLITNNTIPSMLTSPQTQPQYNYPSLQLPSSPPQYNQSPPQYNQSPPQYSYSPLLSSQSTLSPSILLPSISPSISPSAPPSAPPQSTFQEERPNNILLYVDQ